jgi:hypothetical protein
MEGDSGGFGGVGGRVLEVGFGVRPVRSETDVYF